jgi:hypothetical protein
MNCTCEENMDALRRAWWCPKHGQRRLTSNHILIHELVQNINKYTEDLKRGRYEHHERVNC